MQSLLDICTEVAGLFDIKFNAAKSVAGFVGVKVSSCEPVLELQGRKLAWVDSIKYLGINFKLGDKMQLICQTLSVICMCSVFCAS